MSVLSRQDVLYVAKLAKITLSPAEVRKFQKQLAEVVNYVGELSKIDTEGTDPTSQTTGLEDVARTDEVETEPRLKQKDALSGTEDYNGFFKVEAVLTERGEK
jgi:aspartyl-tRNA(Asn)/glutamyl-tRNA(Gln) amidotransferase subunit C